MAAGLREAVVPGGDATDGAGSCRPSRLGGNRVGVCEVDCCESVTCGSMEVRSLITCEEHVPPAAFAEQGSTIAVSRHPA